MSETAPSYGQEWRRGWPGVLAAAIASGAATVHFFSTGLMIGPIGRSMGWSVAQITFGLLLCSIVVVPGAPLVGWLIDRVGQRRVVLVGLPLFFAAFAAIGPLATSYAGWVAAWTIIALVSILTKNNVWIMWVTREFDAARGFALALLMCGSGVFAIFLPFLTQSAIDAFGWRNAYPVLAAAMLLLCYPACWLVLRAPRYDRPAPAARRERRDDESAAGLTLHEAFRSAAFWQLTFASLLAGWGIMSVQVFIAPMLIEKAFEPKAAAATAGLLGASAIAGRLTTGLLLDRYPARLVGMVSMALPAIACFIYLYAPLNWALAALIAVLFGVAMGAEGDVVAYLASRLFGLRNFGTIFGFMAGAVGAGAGAGPFTIGLLRDQFGNYGTVAGILCVAMALTALLIGTLGRHPGELPRGDAHLEPQGSPVP
jgi:MFS family permease